MQFTGSPLMTPYFMLPRKHCLKKKKDFEQVFKKGRALRKDLLSVKFIKTKQEHSRIGIIVSKKVSNKATERNIIKRRVRAAMKELLNKIKEPLDIVIIVHPQASEKTNFLQIKNILEEIFSKAGIIEN
jgi:ribonuclease P protein component